MGEKKPFSFTNFLGRVKRSKPDTRQEKFTTEIKNESEIFRSTVSPPTVKVESHKDDSSVEASSTPPPTKILTREASIDIDPTIPFEPQLLWDEAYDALSEEKPDLLTAYEIILSRELNETLGDEQKDPQKDLAKNLIKKDDRETRRSQMKQLIHGGLKRTEKEAKLKENIGEVTKAITNASNIISYALQACPQAALAWTGVTLAIQVSSPLEKPTDANMTQLLANPIKSTETNRDGIEYVIKTMEWYWELSKHLLNESKILGTSFAELRSELKTQVVDLYKALLSYQIMSVCSYYQNRGLVMLKDIIQLDNWDGNLKDIQAAETAVRQSFNMYNGQQSVGYQENGVRLLQGINGSVQAQLSLQMDFREEDKYHECLKDLRLTDPAADMKRIEDSKDLLLDKSYMWILNESSFSQWRKDEKTRLLWIKGDPGKGKTMLLIGINREISKQDPYPRLLSFFFCQEPDANLNNATAVLRGLIYRLVVQKPSLISYLRKEWDKAGSKLFEGSNTVFTLSEIFVNMISDPSLGYTYLMVDALDECQSGLKYLLKIIVDSVSDPSSRIKWLVSSRHKASIEDSLRLIEGGVELHLEKNVKDQVGQAVNAYIDYKINGLFTRYRCQDDFGGLKDSEDMEKLRNVENEVAKELRNKADGTFLWVALVFRQIAEDNCFPDEVLEAVRKMSSDLNKMYERMMCQIIEQNPKKSNHCKQVLLIMASCYRPLRLSELAKLADIPKLASPRNIIRICGMFSLGGDHEVVSFVHQSAKDYLVGTMAPKLSSEIFPHGKEQGHQLVVSRSLIAMSSGLKRDLYDLKRPDVHLEEIKPPTIDPLASLRYSCKYWTDHLCQMVSEMVADQTELALGVLSEVEDFWNKSFLYWLEALILMNDLPGGISAMIKLLRLFEVSQIVTSKTLKYPDVQEYQLSTTGKFAGLTASCSYQRQSPLYHSQYNAHQSSSSTALLFSTYVQSVWQRNSKPFHREECAKELGPQASHGKGLE